eukprot:gene16727-18421_t
MADKFRESVSRVRKLANVLQLFGAQSPRRQNVTPEDQPTSSSTEPSSSRMTFKKVAQEIRMKRKVAAMFSEGAKPPPEFHPVFQTKTEISAEKQKDIEVEDEKKNILSNLPEMEDSEIVEFVSTELVGKVLNSKIFRRGILTVIITNSLLIAVETNEKIERRYSHLFTVLDQCMMTVFICEILTKWYHGFVKFWKQGWNILDFFIVCSLLFGPVLMSGQSGSRGVLRILRVLRAFRSLRSISSLPGLQVVVQTITQSVPDMANIVLLLVIIMLVFSVIGITLFREVVPEHFGTLSSSMFALFICLTQDGWIEVFERFEALKDDTYYAGGGIFLIVFIVIGAFIFANLVVAVVVTNLECAVLDVRKEEETIAKELELQGISENEEDKKISKIIAGNDIPSSVFKSQEPLFIPEFSNISVEKLENYLLIITAMEDNYVEYLKIKDKLTQIFNEAVEINENVQAELLLSGEKGLGGRRRASSITGPARTGVRMTGDIASGLMAMEGNSVINSRDRSLSAIISHSAEAYTYNKKNRRKRSLVSQT